MPRALTASAPGKLILAGEHAVVHGRPALVAAVDLRLVATVALRPERRPATVRVEVPRLAVAEEIAWPAVRETARAAQQRWEAWSRGEAASFAGAPGGAAHLLALALGEAADFLAEDDPPSLDLAIRSDLPLGSGFGSSAAAAVAVVAAYLALRGALPPGGEAEAPEVRAIAHQVERRQHGLPSGVDVATVLQGGLVWAERDARGQLAIEPFAGGSPLLGDLAVFDTGTPAETTGAVVAAVRERMAAEPVRFERAWDGIEAATRGLRALLEETAPAAARGAREEERCGARGRLVELIRACQAGLEEIGVVPPPVRDLVRRVEAEGGAAKVSGAGALTGPGAGSLLVTHPEPDSISSWSFLGHLTRLPVVLGGPGLLVESIDSR